VSKPLTIAVALLLLAGCRKEPDSIRLCIDGNLGAYRQERIAEAPPGCEAHYVDPQGRHARVRVIPGLAWERPGGAVPFPFEKHTVYSLRKPAQGPVSFFPLEARTSLCFTRAEKGERR